MLKSAQVVIVGSGLAVLLTAGALLDKGPDHRRSPSTAAAPVQTPWKHDWTVRIGCDSYGVCQGLGGAWELYLGSGCIDTATSVRFQQAATGLALLGAAVMLSLGSVALLRVGRLMSCGAALFVFIGCGSFAASWLRPRPVSSACASVPR